MVETGRRRKGRYGISALVVSEGCGELRGAKIGAEQAVEVAHLLGMDVVF